MSDSNSSKRVQFGFSGPRISSYSNGFGISGHGTSYNANFQGHSVSVKKGEFDMGVSASQHGGKLSFALNLLSASYSNPSGSFKPGVSLGMGGTVSAQDDPVKKRTTFSLFPWGGKTGVEFSASHSSMKRFSKHMKTAFDPEF